MPRLTSDEVPINSYRVIWDLMQTVDRRRTIVTHDSGNPRDQMVSFYEAIIPNGYIGRGKSTRLGYSFIYSQHRARPLGFLKNPKGLFPVEKVGSAPGVEPATAYHEGRSRALFGWRA